MAPEAYLYGLPWKYYEELGYAVMVSTARRTAMFPSAHIRAESGGR